MLWYALMRAVLHSDDEADNESDDEDDDAPPTATSGDRGVENVEGRRTEGGGDASTGPPGAVGESSARPDGEGSISAPADGSGAAARSTDGGMPDRGTVIGAVDRPTREGAAVRRRERAAVRRRLLLRRRASFLQNMGDTTSVGLMRRMLLPTDMKTDLQDAAAVRRRDRQLELSRALQAWDEAAGVHAENARLAVAEVATTAVAVATARAAVDDDAYQSRIAAAAQAARAASVARVSGDGEGGKGPQSAEAVVGRNQPHVVSTVPS